MNNQCYGDYFSIEGITYYRCFLDGTILTLPYIQQKAVCSNCQREVVADTVAIVPKVRTIQQIMLSEELGWLDLLPKQ